MNVDFRRATGEQIRHAEQLLYDCRDALNAVGIFQWEESYPNREYLEAAYRAESLFVLTDEDEVVGVVVLDQREATEWNGVPWEFQSPALAVHAFAIKPGAQGKGFGNRLMQGCEEYAREKGYSTLRLDAFSNNDRALRFYERLGFVLRGEVDFEFKPVGHRTYRCYEKLLLPSV